MKNLFDYDDGDFIFTTSDNTAIDSNGNFMMRLNDNMAMDFETGNVHFVPGWHNNQDEDEDD